MEYKGYNIIADGTYGNKTIKPVGKGSVPKALRGAFTTQYFAQKQIDAYLEDTKNGKSKTTT
jgi:hypothetical protein